MTDAAAAVATTPSTRASRTAKQRHTNLRMEQTGWLIDVGADRAREALGRQTWAYAGGRAR
jgi:hypothetical protein